MTVLNHLALAFVSLLTATSTTAAQVLAVGSQGAEAPASPNRSSPDGQTAEDFVTTRYRLGASDVIELIFPYVPELDQILTVQPDGYVTVRPVGELRVQGRTIPELRQMLYEAFEKVLREPVITVVLKEFEKPFFVAAGEVKAPGKFDLRGTISVTQALALAGGFTDAAKHSQVILFRRYSPELLEVKQLNVKKMMATRDLSEDHFLRPGDTVFVPRNILSRIKPYLPTAGLGFYLNPIR
jgi:polysaccharide export outer membrane protein